MNIPHTIRTLVTALALGAGSLTTGFAAEEKDEIVPLAQLPPAVLRTIQAQQGANSATLGEVEKENENGKVIYEAKLTLPNGKKLEVKVAADGSLVKVEADDEDEKDGDKDEKDDDDKK